MWLGFFTFFHHILVYIIRQYLSIKQPRRWSCSQHNAATQNTESIREPGRAYAHDVDYVLNVQPKITTKDCRKIDGMRMQVYEQSRTEHNTKNPSRFSMVLSMVRSFYFTLTLPDKPIYKVVLVVHMDTLTRIYILNGKSTIRMYKIVEKYIWRRRRATVWKEAKREYGYKQALIMCTLALSLSSTNVCEWEEKYILYIPSSYWNRRSKKEKKSQIPSDNHADEWMNEKGTESC